MKQFSLRISSRLILLFLCLASSFLVLGCGSSNNSPAAPAVAGPPAYTYPFDYSWSEYTGGGGYLYGVAAQNGDVFIADASGHVQKFDQNGNFEFQYPVAGATGLCMDKNNILYVTDNSGGLIRKFDINGISKGTLGTNGTGGPGQFSNPWGIAVDSGLNLYVADAGNSRVQKYTSGTSTWSALPSSGTSAGTGNGQFDYPRGIAVDAGGKVYVTDTGNYRIQILDSNLVYQSSFGSLGTGTGNFSTPFGITVDSDGNLLIADATLGKVRKYSATGTYLAEIGAGKFTNPMFVAVDSNKNVYVTDNNNATVLKFAPY